jgi:hypothetical protein
MIREELKKLLPQRFVKVSEERATPNEIKTLIEFHAVRRIFRVHWQTGEHICAEPHHIDVDLSSRDLGIRKGRREHSENPAVPAGEIKNRGRCLGSNLLHREPDTAER